VEVETQYDMTLMVLRQRLSGYEPNCDLR